MQKAKGLISFDEIDRQIATAHQQVGRMLSQPDHQADKLLELKGMVELRDRLRGL